MTKYRVTFFTGSPDSVEIDINNWLDEDITVEVVKIHRPVWLGGHDRAVTVMVEYTFEKETYGA